MISALDSRYADKLTELEEIVGEESFVYFMLLWSVAWVDTCGHTKLSMDMKITNRKFFNENFYPRIKSKEKIVKHQMVAVLECLKEELPERIVPHIGLTSEDIMHNARSTQVTVLIKLINEKIDGISDQLSGFNETKILEFTHGQPATPVDMGLFLEAKLSKEYLVHPIFRLGGSNGQLTALKLMDSDLDVHKLAISWFNNFSRRYNLEDSGMMQTEDLLQVGPSNHLTFTSGMTTCLKLRALSRTFWDFAKRGIIRLPKDPNQAGSSAMPHKLNPIGFENAEGAFTNAYSILLNSYEANCDTRGLRDLSNSIVNRQMIEGWVYLYLGLKSLEKAIEESWIDHDVIKSELISHPECLSELVRYYDMRYNDKTDPYWRIKSEPPTDFVGTLSYMVEWERNLAKDFKIRTTKPDLGSLNFWTEL